GDRRQLAHSGHAKCQPAAPRLELDQEVVMELVLANDVHRGLIQTAPLHPTQHAGDTLEGSELLGQLRPIGAQCLDIIRGSGIVHAVAVDGTSLHGKPHSVPRRACSRSIASNSALKFPLPKLREPRRWITSKNSVGRSSTGLVKICSRYPSSSRSTRMPSSARSSRFSRIGPMRSGSSS